jgi:hypothetical protein
MAREGLVNVRLKSKAPVEDTTNEVGAPRLVVECMNELPGLGRPP